MNFRELTNQINSKSDFLLSSHSWDKAEAGGYLSQPNSKVISKSFEDK